MIRIFHPIGQGAYYSERHDCINIVYDCGNLKDSDESNNVIYKSFRDSDVITVLFISHFDFDHVSKVNVLKKHVKKIECVILPLLSKELKTIINSNYAMSDDVKKLINNPIEYFGYKTKIIYVEAEDDQNSINSVMNISELLDFGSSIKTIKSGTAISIDNRGEWVLIPYNYEYKKRSIQLKRLFKSNNIDVNKLNTDVEYALGLDKVNSHKKIKKLNSIYKMIEGTINQNSLILYSGPLSYNHDYVFCGYMHNKIINNNDLNNFELDHRVACVYTGDADFNFVKVSNIFKDVWGNVGTIQIPHHGSLKSYNSNENINGKFRCPISFGHNNTFNHPNPNVVKDIYFNNCVPILVSDEPSSCFVEIIEVLPNKRST